MIAFSKGRVGTDRIHESERYLQYCQSRGTDHLQCVQTSFFHPHATVILLSYEASRPK